MGVRMGTTLLPSILIYLIGSIAASPQFELRSNLEFLEYDSNLGDTNYRLTDAVYPHVMNVSLDVYLSESRFDGFVRMGVEVREAELTQIVFHQKVASISGVNIVDSNGNPVPLQFPEPFTLDNYYEIIKVNLASAIPVGNYTITVRYVGTINENPVDRGFYKGYYYLNNQERVYATTQFQPYHARKAFPCFDEPMFKSRYIIDITRDSSLSPTYSNMAIAQTNRVGSRIQEIFYPTPIISAYLVAFHVSDFVETELSSTDARPFKIISRPGVTNQHPYAAEIGVKITNELDDYLGIPYHEMGQGVLMKNDHIALPDFPSGAMENWGMVNYREAYLLYDKNNTNLINKIFIATIMAHELGHKWFGNLVTCHWWSNLWLNESFASFFEYFAAHWADPSLELDHQFVIDYVQSALAADALLSAAPMNWREVADNPSITSHFSTTSYAKGASVLKMMEHFVGVRNFRNALRYYLSEHAYKIGTPDDMYAAFKKAVAEDFQFLRDFPNVDVGTVFESWVENPGAPVVNVHFDTLTGAITISQQRFLISGTRPNDTWQIPITWTHEDALDFTNTKPKLILSTGSTSITHTAGDKWVLFNVAQSGLYRVNYDEYNWYMIGNYLKTNNREKIHKLNRAQIVNDLLYFVRSREINQTLAFEVLDYLRFETDYYVWAGAIGQLDFLRRRFEHIPYANTVFTSYLLEIMDTVIKHLGFEERATDSTSTILNRMQIMNFACNLNHTGCVTDALNKWKAYRENDTKLVPVNLRRYVYCVGLREGDASDYQFLLQKYEESENTADMVVILRALACTKNETSILDYLRQSMDNRKIRIHDKTNAWNFALQGNKENLPIVLGFLYQNYAEMRTKYGGPARLNIVLNAIPAFLTDISLLQAYQAWLYSEQIGLGESFATGVAGVNTALNNLEWGSENVEEIYNYLNSSAATIVTSTLLLLVAMFTQLLR